MLKGRCPTWLSPGVNGNSGECVPKPAALQSWWEIKFLQRGYSADHCPGGVVVGSQAEEWSQDTEADIQHPMSLIEADALLECKSLLRWRSPEQTSTPRHLSCPKDCRRGKRKTSLVPTTAIYRGCRFLGHSSDDNRPVIFNSSRSICWASTISF